MDIAANAEKALRIVREAKDVVYDTETSGVDWRYNNPVGYVVGDDNEVVYVPIRHGGGGNILGGKPMQTPTDKIVVHQFEKELAAAFKARSSFGRVVGHNTKFDAHMSANVGILLGRRMACTQNQEAMLDEYARHYSLESCAERRGVTAKKGEALYAAIAAQCGGPADRSSMQHFWRTAGNHPEVVDYSEGDGVSTLELYRKQCELLREDGMETVQDLENDLIWVIFRMERRGIKIDMEQMFKLREATEIHITKILKGLPPGFNVRSGPMIKKLMDEAGHVDYPRTDLGNPSFTEGWLKKNPFGKQIIEIRRGTNLINSFINPLEKEHVFNGRVHASLHQLKSDETGTISGRFSCSGPNLQQVPKRVKELAKPFRRLFIADEGKLFWERDWSQAEPRLFAHYSGSPRLLEGYNSQPFRDMHTVTAEMLKVERDPTAKRMGMGILTGMQSKALAGHMGCSLDQSNAWLHEFFNAFPEIRQFQNNAKSRLLNRGFVFTLLGRRCRLEHPRFAYRGTSKIIQGGQADMMKWKIREMDRVCEDAGDICQILMTIHDSNEGDRDDTPEGEALLDEIIHIFEDVQGEPFNLKIPFVAEGGEGANWSEASFGVD